MIEHANPSGAMVRRWLSLLALSVAIWSSQAWGGAGSILAANAPQTPRDGSPGVSPGGRRDSAEADDTPPPFQIGPTQPQPADAELPAFVLKPGHWVWSAQRMRSNESDFKGVLETVVVDAGLQPAAVQGTQYGLVSSRPVILPKGQEKLIDALFFVPIGDRTVRVTSRLTGAEFSRTSPDQYRAMPGYQYFLVVLSRDSHRFSYIKLLDSVRPPVDDTLGSSRVLHYQVVMPEVELSVSVPGDFLAWTSIAYLVWRDVEPSTFTDSQAAALLDWLHWGGQLIIDGPDSLDSLRGSFLEPYLPATAAEVREYTTEDLAPLDLAWSPLETSETVTLAAIDPWSGITLSLGEGGAFLPDTQQLLAERSVGRGRVVVSAIRLTQRELVNWRGFDNFVNACLLRRPRRQYIKAAFGDRLTWADDVDRGLDPAITSQVRIFARDERRNTAPPVRPSGAGLGGSPFGPGSLSSPFDPSLGIPIVSDVEPSLESMAGWNDRGAAANAVRGAFSQAGGVRIPSALFVLTTLALYLVVLVPVNYLVFHALGRVEWAWVAAPLVAVAGTLAIIKMAQLDIGFVRAQTEISLLEVHGDYPRGHLSRYAALYASLSTTYDIRFDDRNAVALPFPATSDSPEAAGRGLSLISYQRDQSAQLSGILVKSNSVSLVHGEQMIDLGGALRLRQGADAGFEVVNETKLSLSTVGIVRRRLDSAVVEGAWIGDLPAGDSAIFEFSAPGGSIGIAYHWNDLVDDVWESAKLTEGSLNVRLLYSLAADEKDLEPGETRLVARIPEGLAGMTVEPAASQHFFDAILVAHLTYPPRTAPLPDVNGPRDARDDWFPKDPDAEKDQDDEEATAGDD